MKKVRYYVIHLFCSIASESIVLTGLKIGAKHCGVCNVPNKFILFGGITMGVIDTAFKLLRDYRKVKKNESR